MRGQDFLFQVGRVLQSAKLRVGLRHGQLYQIVVRVELHRPLEGFQRPCRIALRQPSAAHPYRGEVVARVQLQRPSIVVRGRVILPFRHSVLAPQKRWQVSRWIFCRRLIKYRVRFPKPPVLRQLCGVNHPVVELHAVFRVRRARCIPLQRLRR